MLTSQYSTLRQGYNNQESVRVASSNLKNIIKPAAFSPLAVDLGPGGVLNAVFAQPLYVSGIQVSGSSNCGSPPPANPSYTCNMLVVGTIGGGLYAFNAGDTTSTGGTQAGSVIWSRNQAQGTANQTDYFWVDDCGVTGGPAPSGYGTTGGLPFAGIVATPVIDATVQPPVMYVTSLCQTHNGGRPGTNWFIHKIDVTTGYDLVTSQTQRKMSGNVPGSFGAYDLTNDSTCPAPAPPCVIPFMAWEEIQWSSLLKVNVSGASSPMIYVPFGFGNALEKYQPYHGWLFGFDSSLNQKFIFASTTKGTADGSGNNNTDTPACSPTCSCSGGSRGPSTCASGCCVTTGYQTAANWCGHFGGSWMSGGAGATVTDSNGVAHAFFGFGNGAFQQWAADGTTLLSSIQNWGQSIVDFTSSASAFDSSPSQYFVPAGGRPVQPPQGNIGYAFEGLNQNDFDTAVSGVMLLLDPAGTWRLITIDKAGYGYLLTVGNLCGSTAQTPQCYPGSPTGQPGLASGDPGDVFPFAASLTPCPDQTKPDLCDRITSMAYNPDGSPRRLYFWASNEKLTAFRLSDGSTQISGTGQITWQPGTPTTINININGGGCTPGSNCFTDQVVAGDTLIACGCTPGTNCPIISTVDSSGTFITINQAFPNTCSSGQSFKFSGYFVKPIRDVYPGGDHVQFPGGRVAVTSNGGSSAVVWGLATIGVIGAGYQGTLIAYDASNLVLLWCSNSSNVCDNSSSFSMINPALTNSIFAQPTVANGYVYIPTWGINTAGTQPPGCTSTGSQCTPGVSVYSGH